MTPENVCEEIMRLMRRRWFESLEGVSGLHVLLGSRLAYSFDARKVMAGYFNELFSGISACHPGFFTSRPLESLARDFLDGHYADLEARCMSQSLFGKPVISTMRGKNGEAELCVVRAVNPEYRLDEDWELLGENDDLAMNFPCDMLPAYGTGAEWNRHIAECAILPETIADARLKKAIFSLDAAIDSMRTGKINLSEIFSAQSTDPTIRKILAMTAGENLALPHASAFLFFNARLACINMRARLLKNMDARGREDLAESVSSMEEKHIEDSEFRLHGPGHGHAGPGGGKGEMAHESSEIGEEDGPGNRMGQGERACGPGLGL